MATHETGRPALLLMDFQNGILANFSETDRLLERVRRATRAARDADMPIIWVLVRFRPDYPEVAACNRMFSGIRGTGRLVEGDSSADIHPDLQPEPGDALVTKRRVAAFSGSDLDVLLRAQDIDSLVLAGVATSGVVLSTVRSAADLDYRITVLEDACADADSEVHRVLTEKVFPRQAEVLGVDDWLASLA